MDQYFEWYEMTEDRKFKFAKLRLIRQARMYWDTVERLIRQRTGTHSHLGRVKSQA